MNAYEDFLDLMDFATDLVHNARGAVNPDGNYWSRSARTIDQAIARLQQARLVLESMEDAGENKLAADRQVGETEPRTEV